MEQSRAIPFSLIPQEIGILHLYIYTAASILVPSSRASLVLLATCRYKSPNPAIRSPNPVFGISINRSLNLPHKLFFCFFLFLNLTRFYSLCNVHFFSSAVAPLFRLSHRSQASDSLVLSTALFRIPLLPPHSKWLLLQKCDSVSCSYLQLIFANSAPLYFKSRDLLTFSTENPAIL